MKNRSRKLRLTFKRQYVKRHVELTPNHFLLRRVLYISANPLTHKASVILPNPITTDVNCFF